MERLMRVSLFSVVCLLGLGATSCQPVLIEPLAKPPSGINDRVTVRGTVCTDPPDPSGFPVKVLFLVDRSGSMCITDPPGSEPTGPNTLCNNFMAPFSAPGYMPPNNFCEPDGQAHPGRVCAIYQLLSQFKNSPNVQAALVPFDVTVSGEYPTTGSFAPVNDNNFAAWVDAINVMQSQLGNGTDYQGAFAETYQRIASDITDTTINPKSQRPRTRYVVVFLTDGVPFPRCTSDSTLPAQDYASPTNPDGIWPDSPGAGCPSEPGTSSICKGVSYPNSGCFCTANQPYIDCILGQPGLYTPNADRNQNYQIYNQVDQIMNLRKTYDIADLKMDAILLWNWGNINTLSLADQQDIFGDVGFNDPVQAEHDDAVHLLQEIALVHGNGTYQEFNDVVSIQLGALDYTSLASPYVLKNLLVENINSRPGVGGGQVDTDGEGLIDTLDNSFTAGTNKFKTDTDGDGFDDYFEYTHEAEGFNPTVPDVRGCEITANSTPTAAMSCADTDGDDLSAAAELYLGTDSTLPDSDTDGVPDGMEVKFGMDPAVSVDPLTDTDGDGTPDYQEVRIHSDPMVADTEYQAEYGYNYEITAVPQGDGGNGVTCYNYSVSNIQMVTTQSSNGVQEGYNVIKLYFDEAPQSNVATDYGDWREACVLTQFAPPTLRVPAGPEVDLVDTDFVPLYQIKPESYPTECVIPPN